MTGSFCYSERNFGCRIETNGSYKNMRILVLQNEIIRMSLLLDKGSDIYEILYKPKDIDFLWRSPQGIRKIDQITNFSYENFMDHYHGGWQELFPSASGSSIYEGISTGFHGEATFSNWDYEILKDTPEEIEVLLKVKMKRTPFLLEKKIRLESNNPIIFFEERMVNCSNRNLHYMWGHHPSFGAPFLSEDCILSLPDCLIKTPTKQSANNRFPAGQQSSWPFIKDIYDNTVNLKAIPGKNINSTDMLYTTALKEGWFSLTNKRIGIGIGMVWPVEMFPYIWIWQEFGGTQGYPWYGNAYALGVELFNSLPNNGEHGLKEAIENGTVEEIPGYGEVRKEFKVVIFEHDSEIKRIGLSGMVEY